MVVNNLRPTIEALIDEIYQSGLLTAGEYNDIIGEGVFDTEENVGFVKRNYRTGFILVRWS